MRRHSWSSSSLGLLLACAGDPTDTDSNVDASESGSETTADTEGDTRLFNLTGVWALERYSIDGGPFTDIAQNRKDRFLLRFRPDDGVVAAAACHEQGTDVDVDSSNCTNGALSTWSCRCFAYTFDDSLMVWHEFAPGEAPPPVGSPGDPGIQALSLAAVLGGDAYEFGPLPAGLFNSDGQVSKHVFGLVAESVWTAVDLDTDGTADLDACSLSCFPSGA